MRRTQFISVVLWLSVIIGLFHLIRTLFAWPITIGDWELPFLVSWLVVVVTAWLVVLGIMILHRHK